MKEQTTSLWQLLTRWHLGFGQDQSRSSRDSDFPLRITSTSSPGSFDQVVRSCFQARVQSVSHGGMNLIVRQHVDPGTLLKIEAGEENDLKAPFLWMRVLHAVPGDDDKVVLGCIFPCEL